MSGQEFNEGHVAEAIDRCHVIMTMIDELLRDHPAIEKSDLGREVERASEEVMNIYQTLSSFYAED
jgi:hypothetical protein